MSFNLGDFIFFFGFLLLSISLSHYLYVLLSLEFCMMSVFFISCFTFSFKYFLLDVIFFFLLVMVMEGIFGISILISITRSYGGDFFSLGFFG